QEHDDQGDPALVAVPRVPDAHQAAFLPRASGTMKMAVRSVPRPGSRMDSSMRTAVGSALLAFSHRDCQAPWSSRYSRRRADTAFESTRYGSLPKGSSAGTMRSVSRSSPSLV